MEFETAGRVAGRGGAGEQGHPSPRRFLLEASYQAIGQAAAASMAGRSPADEVARLLAVGHFDKWPLANETPRFTFEVNRLRWQLGLAVTGHRSTPDTLFAALPRLCSTLWPETSLP
jgi:hypothetical protein